jgi:hypothetical protein
VPGSGVFGEQDVSVGGERRREDVAVLGIHCNGLDGGEVAGIDLDECVLDVVVHQLLQP